MPKRILIVEDDALIAMALAQDVEDAGFHVAGPCMNVVQALHTLEMHSIDAAILDVNLGDETSEQIAIALKSAQIPFVVATGYGDDALPGALIGAPKLDKPLQLDRVIAFLESC